MSTKSTTLIASIAVGSVILLSAAASLLNRSKLPTNEEVDGSRDLVVKSNEDEDCITAEEVCQIFDTLFLHMQSVLAQLTTQIQQIQMTGQQIPEKQLRQLIKAEFERALQAKSAKLLEEKDMDEDCLEEATWEFLAKEEEHPKVKKAVERFQKLYENVSGESVVGYRPGKEMKPKSIDADVQDLSKEKLLEAAHIYFEALTAAMSSIVKSMKSQGLNLSDPANAQKLQMQFAAVANDAGEEALQKLGVTVDGFRKNIEKYAENPEVGRALAMLQMKQQQELMAMGVPPM